MRHVVSVKLLGYLQRPAGCRETSVEVDDGATVLDLLAILAERYGADFASAIFRTRREVHTHLRVFLNGEEASVTDRVWYDREAPEVAVLVLPAFEGGRE